MIRNDEGLMEILKIEKAPSSDATGDWLRRIGEKGGLEALMEVERVLKKWGMKKDGIKNYTLDIDATGIEAEKESAKMTYKGFRDYMPMVGHLAENGLVIGDEFREDNVVPAARNLEFIKHCINRCPGGRK